MFFIFLHYFSIVGTHFVDSLECPWISIYFDTPGWDSFLSGCSLCEIGDETNSMFLLGFDSWAVLKALFGWWLQGITLSSILRYIRLYQIYWRLSHFLMGNHTIFPLKQAISTDFFDHCPWVLTSGGARLKWWCGLAVGEEGAGSVQGKYSRRSKIPARIFKNRYLYI